MIKCISQEKTYDAEDTRVVVLVSNESPSGKATGEGIDGLPDSVKVGDGSVCMDVGASKNYVFLDGFWYLKDASGDENKVTITWKNGEETLDTDKVVVGTIPVYTGETPTKDATAQYTYTFSGWTPAVAKATSDATYTATFTETVNEYDVTFKNYDDSVLQTGKVAYGSTPAYTGETPTKPDDAEYTYEFSGWSPEIASVTEDATYVAQFTATPIT